MSRSRYIALSVCSRASLAWTIATCLAIVCTGVCTGACIGACSGDGPAPLDPGPPYPLDDQLRVSDLQMGGTHNSYHVEPENPIDDSHRYTHAPLSVQLAEQGIRAFELDVHEDEPGAPLSVYHIKLNTARIDAETTCELFTDCLTEIRAWADVNRGHMPIMIWIEVKDDAGGLPILQLDQFEAEILSVIPRERLFTPDDLRGDHASVRAALEADGWARLGAARNKFMFLLLEGEYLQELYTYEFTSLAGRLAFVKASPDQFDMPWAAVAKINNPASDQDIADAHAAGILVASNLCGADTDDAECQMKLDAGLQNGVHMLMDDFPALVPGRQYELTVPGGTPARCNPVTAPGSCTSEAIENL